MFSKASQYGIRALIYLVSEADSGRKVSVRELSQKIDIPEAFTAKILQILGRQGLVSSVKGPRGGFFMDSNASDLPVIEVVRAIDGRDVLSGCTLGLPKCDSTHPCPLHDKFAHIRDELVRILSDMTIQQMASRLNAGEVFLKQFESAF